MVHRLLICWLTVLTAGCEMGGSEPLAPSEAAAVSAMESSRPVCTEACGEIECGIGPCGQLCGACRLGSVCAAGVCVCSEDGRAESIVENHCGQLTARGECSGNTVRRCRHGEVEQLPCTAIGRVCAWDPQGLDGVGAYACKAKDEAVHVCTPNCAERICGDDGCGGHCGTCPGDMVCLTDGTCTAALACGSDESIGTCQGDNLVYCADGCPVTVACAHFGQRCGFDTTAERFDCLPCDGACPTTKPTERNGCNDGNDCTFDERVKDVCIHSPRPDGIRCGVSDVCIVDAQCQLGECVVSTRTACDDGDPCTQDICAPGVGCEHLAIDSVPCDDGDPCTSTDTCRAGACVGGAPPPEVCNGFDDDCDGVVDDACECVVDKLHHSGLLTALEPFGEPAAVIQDIPVHWKAASQAMPDSSWIWRSGGQGNAHKQQFRVSFLVPEQVEGLEGMLSIAADHDVTVLVNGVKAFDTASLADSDSSLQNAGFAFYLELDDWLILGSNAIDIWVQHPAPVTEQSPAGLIFELSTVYRYPSVDGVCPLLE